jgi:hypothetical protein
MFSFLMTGLQEQVPTRATPQPSGARVGVRWSDHWPSGQTNGAPDGHGREAGAYPGRNGESVFINFLVFYDSRTEESYKFTMRISWEEK